MLNRSCKECCLLTAFLVSVTRLIPLQGTQSLFSSVSLKGEFKITTLFGSGAVRIVTLFGLLLTVRWLATGLRCAVFSIVFVFDDPLAYHLPFPLGLCSLTFPSSCPRFPWVCPATVQQRQCVDLGVGRSGGVYIGIFCFLLFL